MKPGEQVTDAFDEWFDENHKEEIEICSPQEVYDIREERRIGWNAAIAKKIKLPERSCAPRMLECSNWLDGYNQCLEDIKKLNEIKE